jgi:hypothetical protein
MPSLCVTTQERCCRRKENSRQRTVNAEARACLNRTDGRSVLGVGGAVRSEAEIHRGEQPSLAIPDGSLRKIVKLQSNLYRLPFDFLRIFSIVPEISKKRRSLIRLKFNLL